MTAKILCHALGGCSLLLASQALLAEPVVSKDTVEKVKEQLPYLGRGTASFYFENDLFSHTDQDYTNGVRFSLASPNLENFNDDFIQDEQLKAFFDWLNPKLEMFHPRTPDGQQGELSSRRIVLSLGQNIYTPHTRDATELLPNERPYAGWLYLGVAYHARYGDQLKTVGVNLGVVGPLSLAKQTQDLVHDLRGFEKFKGWDNQLHNEPGIQLVYEKKNKWINQVDPGFGYDVIGHYGASLGNVATYANAGAEARIGWNIPNNFGTSALRAGGDNHTPDGLARHGLGVHFFVATDMRYVARDIFLDGNTFVDSPSVEKRNWVADASYGVSMVYEQFSLSYAQVLRTRQYKLQPESHQFGSITMAWNYRF